MEQPTGPKSLIPSSGLNTIYEIPLEEAQRWTKAWADRGNFVKGFLVEVDELKEILEVPGTCYVRVYFGWEEEAQPGVREKMILVPVNENGFDMVPDEARQCSNVYDFTQPCPPTCDTTSKLYYPTKVVVPDPKNQ